MPAYDCSPFPPAESSPYLLPWSAGESYEAFPHIAKGDAGPNKYSIDIAMPIGTTVRAIAGGVVIAVRDSYHDGDHAVGHENAVLIRHPDGTGAAYGHFTHRGVVVREGDTVAQGDVIGYSGNTGQSTGPHLHFHVLRHCNLNLPLDPDHVNACAAEPVTFRNASPRAACGLSRRTYKALPY